MKVELVLHRVFEKGYLKFEIPLEESLKAKLISIVTKCNQSYGDYIKVTLSEPRRSRSMSQNAKFHAMVTELADYTGDEIEYLKYELKVSAMRRGYPCKTDSNGDPLISKRDGRPIPKSTTEVTTEEMGYLIEETAQIAAEMGVYLSE